MIVRRSDKAPVALPILSLLPSAGNTGKLIDANTLIRSVYRLFQGVKVRVLVDSWYMWRCCIESMQTRGFDVIGQVRIDTRLYDEPPPRKKGQRGRPRKYGKKYIPLKGVLKRATNIGNVRLKSAIDPGNRNKWQNKRINRLEYRAFSKYLIAISQIHVNIDVSVN